MLCLSTASKFYKLMQCALENETEEQFQDDSTGPCIRHVDPGGVKSNRNTAPGATDKQSAQPVADNHLRNFFVSFDARMSLQQLHFVCQDEWGENAKQSLVGLLPEMIHNVAFFGPN